MEIIAYILTGIVALEHFYIMYMEMFAWETLGKKTFRGSMPDEMFSKTKTMAYNQGAYNGFLAAGLTWTFFIQNEEWSKNIAIFFLIVIVAGIVGAVSVSKRIFYTQSVPALIALAGVLFFL
jgi:putative membrane protein